MAEATNKLTAKDSIVKPFLFKVSHTLFKFVLTLYHLCIDFVKQYAQLFFVVLYKSTVEVMGVFFPSCYGKVCNKIIRSCKNGNEKNHN